MPLGQVTRADDDFPVMLMTTLNVGVVSACAGEICKRHGFIWMGSWYIVVGNTDNQRSLHDYPIR